MRAIAGNVQWLAVTALEVTARIAGRLAERVLTLVPWRL